MIVYVLSILKDTQSHPEEVSDTDENIEVGDEKTHIDKDNVLIGDIKLKDNSENKDLRVNIIDEPPIPNILNVLNSNEKKPEVKPIEKDPGHEIDVLDKKENERLRKKEANQKDEIDRIKKKKRKIKQMKPKTLLFYLPKILMVLEKWANHTKWTKRRQIMRPRPR